jgi:hypothetical protein
VSNGEIALDRDGTDGDSSANEARLTDHNLTTQPWLMLWDEDCFRIVSAFQPSSADIAIVRRRADAELIAVAPELLASLEWAEKFLRLLIGESAQVQTMANVIAKARSLSLRIPTGMVGEGE